jgi:hypothetical protein
MKKQNLFTVLLVLLAISACKKDNKTTLDPKNQPYSTNSVAKVKSDMENTGIRMESKMNDLTNTKGMQVTMYLVTLITSPDINPLSNQSGYNTLKSAALFGRKKAGIESIFASLRQTSDDIGLVQSFDSIRGIYKYNFNDSMIEKVADSNDSFKVYFPASSTDKAAKNLNALFEISKPTVQTGPFTYDNSSVASLPAFIQYDIKVNGIVELNYLFTGTYSSVGMPTSISSTLTIGTFEFNSTWGYSVSDVKLNYSIKDSAKTIVDIGWEMTGNFDKTNIQTVNNNPNGDPTLILTNANAHFQFYNIKIAGQIDFKDFYGGVKNILKETSPDSTRNIEGIALVKKDISLVVVYADNGQLIAKVEPYLKTFQDTLGRYNPATGTYTTVPTTYTTIDFRMVFSDKSNIDFNVYLLDGFSNLSADFEQLLSELNSYNDTK